MIWEEYRNEKGGKVHFTQTGRMTPPVECDK